MQKVNFVYKTFEHLGSSYFGNLGLKWALERAGLLHYSYNVNGNEFLDEVELQKCPVFFMRGGMSGMGKAIEACGNQFKASFESESYYSRHGTVDDPGLKERLKKFDMIFTCAESDLDKFHVKAIFCPVWAEIVRHG
jgi:hypothetical protein